MYELDKQGNVKRDSAGRTKAKTSHTLNPVPFVLISGGAKPGYTLRDDLATAGLSNVAATILNLLGYEAPAGYDPSLIKPS
jgi:2,3-bisphosphoglycerate-independent phosphoglycerate mutase